MTERTSIPAALRRQVLIEAGHRCAIHTCRHPTVDLHHIIPWERCRAHSFDNLIALCPNCHRQADAGKIDRKSLLMYISRLAAVMSLPSNGELKDPVPTSPNGMGWRVEQLIESSRDYPPWDLELEHPHFIEQDEDLAQLNTLLKARALSQLHEMRRLRINPGLTDEGWEDRPTAVSTVSESFWVACLTPELVSLRVSRFSYGAGAAHPNHTTAVLNFARRPLTPLELEDILELGNGGLKRLGDTCRVLLGVLQQDEDDPDEDAVFISAFAQATTFRHFNLLPAGLLITVDPGNVGPMCDGTRQVLISPDRLQDLVREDSPIRGLWGMSWR